MKKVFVRKDDYDLYSIRIPVRFVFGRKRRSFVARELEKIHPNYSVSSSVEDMKLAVGRKGLFADVAVMERDRLSSYKSASDGRARLFLEGLPGRSVFDGGRRRGGYLAFAAISLCAVFAVRFAVSALSSPAESVETSSLVSGGAGRDGAASTASAALLAPQELFAAVLASVKAKGGRVTNLSWLGGKCSFAISGCNSEDVAAANYCVVSYSSGKPQFNFVSQVNERKMAARAVVSAVVDSSGGIRASFEKVDNVLPLLRNCVLARGAEVLSEKLMKDSSSISFVCEPERLKETLLSVSETARVSGWCETGVSVDCDGFFVSVSASFKNLAGKIAKFDNPLSVLAEHSEVFTPSASRAEPSAAASSMRASAAKNAKGSRGLLVAERSESSARVKIGEIKRGGRSFVYYRSPEGKVTSEVLDAN